jgi:4-amino-4-deoxy-L-arabinose transferase-like glycosyltransferase
MNLYVAPTFSASGTCKNLLSGVRGGARNGQMTATTRGMQRPATTALRVRKAVDYVSGSHLRTVAVLIVLSLCAFLPGFFSIPPVDRDEARFAQATKQMIETGDYVDIRFQEEHRYKKPVGIYWLQAAVVNTAETLGVSHARTRIWLYRIPSLFGATGAVLLTYWTALAFVSRRAALFAAGMLATSVLLGVEARLAKTDAMLLATIVAAMGALGRAYLDDWHERIRDNPWFLPAVFWTAVAAGILLKGPLILMFVGLTILVLFAFDRSLRWLFALKPLVGIAWMLLLILPWFVAITLRSGESFFADSIAGDMLSKVASGQESHGAPPGTYFVLFWATFFPGAMLAGLAAPAVWRDRAEPGAKFLLAFVLPSWLVLEMVVTKLPHYVLPLYPAIAILIAGVLDNNVLSRRPWLERGVMWWFLFTIGIATVALYLHIRFAHQAGLAAWPFAVAALILALFAWWLYQVDGAEMSLIRAGAAAIMTAVGLYGLTFPQLPRLFPSPQLARIVRSAPCARPLVGTAGYHEPSLVFLVGTELQHLDGLTAAEFLNRGGCRIAFVESRQERSFVQRADSLGLRYIAGPRIDGVNISGGRPVSIAVYISAERGP